MTVVIEEGTPIPPKGQRSKMGKRLRIPWSKMEIGDSFYVEGISLDGARAFATKKTGFIFSQRGIGLGIRIWRVA